MKKILLLLFIFVNIQAYSQNFIGKTKEDVILYSSNIDSLDDGTIFIKSSIDNREYYYFFNDDNICFCMIINFINDSDLNEYCRFLNKKYKYRKGLWKSKDGIFFKKKDFGLEHPLIFIWSNNNMFPEDWDYHK